MAGYRDTLFGGQSMFTRKTSPPSGGTNGTSGQPNSQPQANQTQPFQTFSQLQQNGVARPAPPAPQLQQNQQYGGSQQANQTRGLLQTQVANAMQNPGRYNTQAYQQIEGAARANLDADYQQSLSQMNTDMARRGLYDSTYAAQNWQSLAGQRQRGIADLNASLLMDAANTNAQDQLAANQMGLSLADLAGSQDLAQFEANRVATALDNENAMNLAQFGQNQYEFDQGNALEAAKSQGQLQNDQDRMALDEELGLGNLDIRQGELDQSGSQFGQSLTLEQQKLAQQGEQSNMDRALRERLGMGELGVSQGNLALQGELGRGGLALDQQRLGLDTDKYTSSVDQANADRALQQMIATSDIGLRGQELAQKGQQFTQGLEFEGGQNDLQRQLQLAMQGSDLGFQREQMAQQGSQFDRGLTLDQQRLAEQNRQFDVQAQDTDLSRALQDRLGSAELSGRLDGQNTVARDQATADQDLAQQNLLAQLLGMLGMNIDDFNPPGQQGGSTNTGGGFTPPPPPPSGGGGTGGGGTGNNGIPDWLTAWKNGGGTIQPPNNGTPAQMQQLQVLNQILPILLAGY